LDFVLPSGAVVQHLIVLAVASALLAIFVKFDDEAAALASESSASAKMRICELSTESV
jgi:hypothetical protein